MNNVIRVMIVDDHEAVREALRALVNAQDDMEVCAEASTGPEALQRVPVEMPDIVLMDVSMPGWSGSMTTRKVIEACPLVKIIAVSRHDDPSIVRAMWEAGAAAYVQKQTAARDLVDAIRAVAKGKMHGPVAHAPASPVAVEDPQSREHEPEAFLTEAEERVLRLVATAASHDQIGRSLSLSSADAIALKSRAMEKAGLSSRIQVVGYAQRRGWID